jgi:hypothetical protein
MTSRAVSFRMSDFLVKCRIRGLPNAKAAFVSPELGRREVNKRLLTAQRELLTLYCCCMFCHSGSVQTPPAGPSLRDSPRHRRRPDSLFPPLFFPFLCYIFNHFFHFTFSLSTVLFSSYLFRFSLILLTFRYRSFPPNSSLSCLAAPLSYSQ